MTLTAINSTISPNPALNILIPSCPVPPTHKTLSYQLSAVQYTHYDLKVWWKFLLYQVSYSYAFHTKQYLVHQHTNFSARDIVGNWDSSVSIVTRLQVVSLRNFCWMCSRAGDLFICLFIYSKWYTVNIKKIVKSVN